MNVVFRVDSGLKIGTGHLIRCLTLAKLLRGYGASEIFFICRPHKGSISEMILENDFILLSLSEPSRVVEQSDCATWLGESKAADADETRVLLSEYGIEHIDLLVIDHYAIDYLWEASFSKMARKTLVIDDLGNRQHECDVLLDQNVVPNIDTRYVGLVPDRCELFLGISYCLLGSDFFALRTSVSPRRSLDNVLIFFGGVDVHGCTRRLLVEFGERLKCFDRVDVVVGRANPAKASINKLCQKYENCQYHEQTPNMAQLIAQADFSIGACGAVTGERIFLGLPSIIVSVADNQLEVAKHLHDVGSVYYIGDHAKLNVVNVERAIKDYLGSVAKICDVSKHLIGASESNLDAMLKKLVAQEG